MQFWWGSWNVIWSWTTCIMRKFKIKTLKSIKLCYKKLISLHTHVNLKIMYLLCKQNYIFIGRRRKFCGSHSLGTIRGSHRERWQNFQLPAKLFQNRSQRVSVSIMFFTLVFLNLLHASLPNNETSCNGDKNSSKGEYAFFYNYLTGTGVHNFNESLTIGFLGAYGQTQVVLGALPLAVDAVNSNKGKFSLMFPACLRCKLATNLLGWVFQFCFKCGTARCCFCKRKSRSKL